MLEIPWPVGYSSWAAGHCYYHYCGGRGLHTCKSCRGHPSAPGGPARLGVLLPGCHNAGCGPCFACNSRRSRSATGSLRLAHRSTEWQVTAFLPWLTARVAGLLPAPAWSPGWLLQGPLWPPPLQPAAKPGSRGCFRSTASGPTVALPGPWDRTGQSTDLLRSPLQDRSQLLKVWR
jgi:hypothetical protein